MVTLRCRIAVVGVIVSTSVIPVSVRAMPPAPASPITYARVLARLQRVSQVRTVEVDQILKHGPMSVASMLTIRMRYVAPHWIDRIWRGLNPVGKPVTVTRVQIGKAICQKTPDFNNGHWQSYNWPLLFYAGSRVDVPRTLRENGLSLPPVTPSPGLGQTLTFQPRSVTLRAGRRAPAIGITSIMVPEGDGGPDLVTYHGKTYASSGLEQVGLLVLDPQSLLPTTFSGTSWALLGRGSAMRTGPKVLAGREHITFTYPRSTRDLPWGGKPPC